MSNPTEILQWCIDVVPSGIDVSDPSSDWHLLGVDFDLDLERISVWKRHDRLLVQGRDINIESRAPRRVRDWSQVVAQRVRDGRYLLAPSNSYEGELDSASVLVSPGGRLSDGPDFGFGLKTIAATRQGSVWIFYSDIATTAGTQLDIQRGGLVKVNSDFNVTWNLGKDNIGGGLVDSYALNASEESVLICSYPDTSLVAITSDLAHRFPMNIDSISAILNADGIVALVGGFAARDHDRCILGRLDFDTGAFDVQANTAISTLGSMGLPDRVACRGRHAAFEFGGRTVRISLRKCVR